MTSGKSMPNSAFEYVYICVYIHCFGTLCDVLLQLLCIILIAKIVSGLRYHFYVYKNKKSLENNLSIFSPLT